MVFDPDVTRWFLLGAAAFAAVGLLTQVIRLLARPRVKTPSPLRGAASDGVRYAFTAGMLPWNKESGRVHPMVFWTGVGFHVGIACALLLVLLRLVPVGLPAGLLKVIGLLPLVGAAILVGNFARRLSSAEMRPYTVPDDYVSVALSALFLAAAGLFGLGLAGAVTLDMAGVLICLYLPLGKVRHMVTFFIARRYHGEQAGEKGIYPSAGAPAGGHADPRELMTSEPGTVEPMADDSPSRLKLTDEERGALASALDDGMSRQAAAQLEACVHCGMCAEACHYYLSTGDPELIPVAKQHRFASLYRAHHDRAGRTAPALVGAAELTDEAASQLHRAAFELCSLCGRCAMTCPMGINTGDVLYQARRALAAVGKAPEGLKKPARVAVEKGNYLGLPVEDVVENLEWLSEELEDELEQEGLEIPLDKESADVLYIPHPLELRDFPMVVMAAAKIFERAGESYTFSSDHFDTVNYAFYGADEARMEQIIKNLVAAARKLKVKRVVLSPCGHGYRVLRWEGERMLGEAYGFEITSLSEIIEQYHREGRIKLDPEKFDSDGKLTYHDPCNLARSGGVVQEPRAVLKALAGDDFVEMAPHGAINYCCGGGGGLAATGEYGKTRLNAGAVKAAQIQKTGAGTVITNCFNCNTQVKELNRKHELKVQVVSITELVADALE